MGPLLVGEEVVPENMTWRGEPFLENKGTREGPNLGHDVLFANKVLLAPSDIHFNVVYDCFHAIMTDLSN